VLLEPETYLNPDLFITNNELENDKNFLMRQFEAGFEHSTTNDTVGISCNGSWFSVSKGQYNVAGQVIGKHPGTASLLKGLLKGQARFVVYRIKDIDTSHFKERKCKKSIDRTIIKETGEFLIDDITDISQHDDYNGIKIYRGVYKNIFHYFFFRKGRRRIFGSVEYSKQMIKYMEENSEIF
jgi:hypothetical protein